MEYTDIAARLTFEDNATTAINQLESKVKELETALNSANTASKQMTGQEQITRFQNLNAEFQRINANIIGTYNALKGGDISGAVFSIANIFGKTLNPILGTSLQLIEQFGQKLYSDLAPEKQEIIRQSLSRLFSPLQEIETDVLDNFANGLSFLSNELFKVIAPTEAANLAFQTQYDRVLELENNLPNLIARYETLTGKTKLTKEEQAEYNELTKKISEIAPEAVIGINQITGAYQINLEVLKNVTGQEREFLKEQTKVYLDLAKAQSTALKEVSQRENDLLKTGIENLTLYDEFGNAINQQFTVNKEKQVQKAKEASKAFLDNENEIKKLTATLNALENGQKLTTSETEKATNATKQNTEGLSKNNDKRKEQKANFESELKSLENQLKNFLDKSKIESAESLEDRILIQKGLELEKISFLETRLKAVYDALKKEYDFEGDFAELRLNLEKETAEKLEQIRRKNTGVTDKLPTTRDSKAPLLDIPIQNLKPINTVQIKAEFDAKAAKESETEFSNYLLKLQTPIDRIQAKLAKVLGLDTTNIKEFDKQRKFLFAQFENIYENINAINDNYIERRITQNENLIKSLDLSIDKQKEIIDKEMALKEQGSANDIDTEQKRLDNLYSQKQDAIQKNEQLERKKLEAQQKRDALSQISTLTLTGIEIFKDGVQKAGILGLLFAAAGVATLLGMVTKFKSDTIATIYENGGRIPITGKDHANGGHKVQGTNIELRRGEWVINAIDSEQQDPLLKAINRGEFRGIDLYKLLSAKDTALMYAPKTPRIFNTEGIDKLTSLNIDFSKLEYLQRQSLKAIQDQTNVLRSKAQIVPRLDKNGYIEVSETANGKVIKNIEIAFNNENLSNESDFII